MKSKWFSGQVISLFETSAGVGQGEQPKARGGNEEQSFVEEITMTSEVGVVSRLCSSFNFLYRSITDFMLMEKRAKQCYRLSCIYAFIMRMNLTVWQEIQIDNNKLPCERELKDCYHFFIR